MYRLCGQFSTDYSDASGTLLLDVKHKKWNDNMLQICSVERSMLPDLHESYEAVGTLLPTLADELGLPVKYVGVGEQVDDLMPFEPDKFVEALLQ